MKVSITYGDGKAFEVEGTNLQELRDAFNIVKTLIDI